MPDHSDDVFPDYLMLGPKQVGQLLSIPDAVANGLMEIGAIESFWLNSPYGRARRTTLRGVRDFVRELTNSPV